jgi:hypothetical protein
MAKWSSNDAVFALQMLKPVFYLAVAFVVLDVLKLTPRHRGE